MVFHVSFETSHQEASDNCVVVLQLIGDFGINQEKGSKLIMLHKKTQTERESNGLNA